MEAAKKYIAEGYRWGVDLDLESRMTRFAAEECGGAAVGAEVSGFQLHERWRTRAADSAESGGPVQGAGAGTDEPDTWREHGTDGVGTVRVFRGWIGYFGRCQTRSVLESLEQWVRRRLRSAIWKQWKRGSVRFAELRKRGVGQDLAAQTAGSAHGPWRLADSPGLHFALPNAYFGPLGIPRLTGGR